MVIGLVLVGMTFGIAGALATVLVGGPVWMALLIYSGLGSLGVLLAGATALTARGRSKHFDESLLP